MTRKKISIGNGNTLVLDDADTIAKNKGLDLHGRAQVFHTQNCLRRIVKYMPYGPVNGGGLIKLTVAQTNVREPVIITKAPQARFLFHGRLMLGDETNRAWARKGETKHVVSTPLSYTKTKNQMAGARWDKALSTNEGAALAADLEKFMKRG